MLPIAIGTVKGRGNLIGNNWKTELHKYIAGIIKGKGHKSIIVNGMHDHIHAFVGLKPVMSISDLARDMKNNSSNFVNDRKFVKGKFAWSRPGRELWRIFLLAFTYRKCV